MKLPAHKFLDSRMSNWWVYIAATLLVGPSFAFPLFLYFRQSRLEAVGADV